MLGWRPTVRFGKIGRQGRTQPSSGSDRSNRLVRGCLKATAIVENENGKDMGAPYRRVLGEYGKLLLARHCRGSKNRNVRSWLGAFFVFRRTWSVACAVGDHFQKVSTNRYLTLGWPARMGSCFSDADFRRLPILRDIVGNGGTSKYCRFISVHCLASNPPDRRGDICNFNHCGKSPKSDGFENEIRLFRVIETHHDHVVSVGRTVSKTK